MKGGMTPAALVAALNGDLANVIVSSTPGGIEAQEAAGNRKFVSEATLPIGRDRGTFEKMGVIFGAPIDDLFVSVTLPAGWKKVAGADSRESYLLDDKGRKRASMFYKAAWYDRYASASIYVRYRAECQPIGGWLKYREGVRFVGVVLDQEMVIWQTEDTVASDDHMHKDVLADLARVWLEERYPDWKNPLAYWED